MGLKRIFANKEGELWKKVWGISSLPQVILIYSIKPISSSISLTINTIITTQLLLLLCRN